MKKPETKHQKSITFYVSDEEYKKIEESSAACFGSVSGYVRHKLGLKPIFRGAPQGNQNNSALARHNEQNRVLRALAAALRDGEK